MNTTTADYIVDSLLCSGYQINVGGCLATPGPGTREELCSRPTESPKSAITFFSRKRGNTHDTLASFARNRQVLERVLHRAISTYAAIQAFSKRSIGAQTPRIRDLDAAVAVVRCFPTDGCACCSRASAGLRQESSVCAEALRTYSGPCSAAAPGCRSLRGDALLRGSRMHCRARTMHRERKRQDLLRKSY